jgi:hypothetical protein
VTFDDIIANGGEPNAVVTIDPSDRGLGSGLRHLGPHRHRDPLAPVGPAADYHLAVLGGGGTARIGLFEVDSREA